MSRLSEAAGKGQKEAERGGPHVVIAGGGVTGWSAAFYISRLFRENALPVRITLVEKSGQHGGKVHTLRRDGFVIEKGADSFLARKLPIIHLTRELGLEAELTATNPKAKKTYILYRGRLHPMPPGLVLGIPTELAPFMKTGLISPLGKARAALDLVLPKRKEEGDESLGSFLTRRLGREVHDHIAEPLLAGIYAGDTHALSLRATFPQFHGVEQKYGSLIRGMMASRNPAAESPELPEAAKGSLFLTYKNGLSSLIEALMKACPDTALLEGQAVEKLERLQSDSHEAAEGYAVSLSSGERLRADAVVLALPLPAAGALLPDIAAMRHLEKTPYVSVANAILAFRAQDLQVRLDGSGFVVPRKEGRFITACTWTSAKWLHTAPEGHVLLRAYVGRSGDEEGVSLPDEELVRRVRADLRDIMGIQADPLFYEVTSLKHSMPNYQVGHLEHVRSLREELSQQMPGVYTCGAGYLGVGIPDCVRQGKETAEQLLQACLHRNSR